MAAASAGLAGGTGATQLPTKAKIKLRRKVVDKINDLNQGGALSKPIRLGAVATVLSALEELAAVALLDRLLEESDSKDVASDPTSWLCREASKAPNAAAESAVAEVSSAGNGAATPAASATAGGFLAAAVAAAAALAAQDAGASTPAAGEVNGASAAGGTPAASSQAAPAVPEGPKKVKLKRKVVDRLKALNADGVLLAPLRLGTVAGSLAELDEDLAVSLLDQLAQDAESIEDPTAWIVGAARGESLAAEQQDEEWKEWEQWEAERAGELTDLLSSAVLEKIRSLNRQLILDSPLKLTAIAGPMALHSDEDALRILEDLEAEASQTENPTAWVLNACFRRCGRVLGQVDRLNRLMYKPGNVFLLSRLNASKVRDPLHAIPEGMALQILSELEKRCHDIEDPTTWVVEAAEQKAKTTGRVVALFKKINESMEPPIACGKEVGKVLDRICQFSEPVAVSVLYDLKQKASQLRSPIGYMFAELQKRSSGQQLPPWKASGDMTPIPMQPGKGGGKAKGGQGECYNCGECGHIARECPKPKGKGKAGKSGEKGAGKAAGKRGKGPGRQEPTTPPKAAPWRKPGDPAAESAGEDAPMAAPVEEDFDAEAAEEEALLAMRQAFGEAPQKGKKPAAQPARPKPAVAAAAPAAALAAPRTPPARRPVPPAKRPRAGQTAVAAAPARKGGAAPVAQAELEEENWDEDTTSAGVDAPLSLGHGDEDDLQ